MATTYTLGVQGSYLFTLLTNGTSFSGATVVGGDTIELAVGDQKRGIVLDGYIGTAENPIIFEGNGQALDATGLPNTLISWGNDCDHITFRNFSYINLTGSVPAMAGRSGSFIFEGLSSGSGATGAQYGIGLKNYPNESDIGFKYRSDFPPDGFANDLIIMRNCNFIDTTNEAVYFGTSHIQDVFVDSGDKTILTEEPMVDRLLIEDCIMSNVALDGYQAQANDIIIRRNVIFDHATGASGGHQNAIQCAGIGNAVVYDNWIDGGIYGGYGILSRNDDLLIFNNIIVNCSIGFWTQLGVNFPNGGGYKIFHNTFVNISDECIYSFNTIARNNKLWNNIMHLTAANVKGYYVEGTAGQDLNMDESNNLEIQGAAALITHFNNAASGDYSLKPGSSALGGAKSVAHIDSRLRLDYENKIRGLDIGAYGEGVAVAPVLTLAIDTHTGETTGGGAVTTDKAEGTLYWVVSQSATTPSIAQIKAGNDHTGSAGDDSGSQTVSAIGSQVVSSTGLTVATTYYTHFIQTDLSALDSNTISADGFTTAAVLGAASSLDTWSSVVETNTLAFSVSAGTNRYLIGIVNHENSTQTVPIGATYGDKAMTLLMEVKGSGGWNSTQIWGLGESDIATAIGTNFVTSGATTPDTPSLGMTSFEGVNQAIPIRDTGSDNAGINPSTEAVLTINTDDMVVMSYASTGGLGTTAWLNEIATPHTGFFDNGADDPSEGIFKPYVGANTTTGEVRVTGGTSNRCPIAVVILAHD